MLTAADAVATLSPTDYPFGRSHTMEEFEGLKQLVADVEDDVAKCGSGNKAAGTRVRKQMQAIKKACQGVRAAVLAMREPPAAPPV